MHPLAILVCVVLSLIVLQGVVAFFSKPAYPREVAKAEVRCAPADANEYVRGNNLELKGNYQETTGEYSRGGMLLNVKRGEWHECFDPDERAEEIANRDAYEHRSYNPSNRDATGPVNPNGTRVY